MNLQLYFPKINGNLNPLFTIPIKAGAAQDIEQVVEWIDLDDYVRRGTEPTYYLRCDGDSMEADVHSGDLLVVERSEIADTGDIVIAEINGEFTVKRLKREKRFLYLVPANPNYKPRQIGTTDDFSVWGIVTHIIRKVKK